MFYLTAILAVFFCFSSSHADEKPLDIDSIAGVYKKSFQNGNIDGTTYNSEDILEIVKISSDTAYFRTNLEFFNGHKCELSGIAELQGNSLVYRTTHQIFEVTGQKDSEGKYIVESKNGQCVFKISRKNSKLVLADDTGVCRSYSCGERGGYSDEFFDLKNRHAIRYMTKLLNSQQYKEALSEYKKVDKTN